MFSVIPKGLVISCIGKNVEGEEGRVDMGVNPGLSSPLHSCHKQASQPFPVATTPDAKEEAVQEDLSSY